MIETMKQAQAYLSKKIAPDQVYLTEDEKGLISKALNYGLVGVPCFSVENMRMIYCMDYPVFRKIFNMHDDDYALGKFRKAQRDMFGWFAELDAGNQYRLWLHFNIKEVKVEPLRVVES